MTQVHERRDSDHPFIDRIWQTRNTADGVYLATPDGLWDLILMVDKNGDRSIAIAGQATKAAHIPYEGGTGSIVISFAAGVYMPHLRGDKLLDTLVPLPNTDESHFILAGHTFAFPTFETVEELVEEMVRLGTLKNDPVVASALSGKPIAASKRAMQRHFQRTTGTSHKQLQQIQRAQEATRLLQQGKKPIEAAFDAGYTDQPHLAKSLKRIMNAKPSNVKDIHKL